MKLQIIKQGAIKALAASALVLVPVLANADSVAVSPTRPTVAKPSKQTTLTVKAGGRQISVVQLRVVAWDPRKDPSDVKPTRDVVVSPPVAKLPPRQELTVRLVRTKRGAAQRMLPRPDRPASRQGTERPGGEVAGPALGAAVLYVLTGRSHRAAAGVRQRSN